MISNLSYWGELLVKSISIIKLTDIFRWLDSSSSSELFSCNVKLLVNLPGNHEI